MHNVQYIAFVLAEARKCLHELKFIYSLLSVSFSDIPQSLILISTYKSKHSSNGAQREKGL